MITAPCARWLFLAIPAAVGLLVWRTPLVRLLLERGEFTAHSTTLTTPLALFSIGLIGHSAVEIQARAFYALHDTRTPVIIGIGAMALNVLLRLAPRPPGARRAGARQHHRDDVGDGAAVDPVGTQARWPGLAGLWRRSRRRPGCAAMAAGCSGRTTGAARRIRF